jgi:DNA-binding PadR family transcriptional regulator
MFGRHENRGHRSHGGGMRGDHRNDLWGSSRHGRGGGHRGGGRGFEHGKLRLVLLKLIAEKPSHGYELIKAIEERTGGSYAPSPGVIYPTLTMLEEMGHIALDDSDGQRKLCTITAAGKKHLTENKAALDDMEARLATPRRGRGEEVAPPVIRAMENLRTALHLRLNAGALSREQSQAVAAALDAAATTIERL